MAHFIIFDEGIGFRLETEQHRIDPTSAVFSFFGTTLPFEQKLRDVIVGKSFRDGDHLIWHGVNVYGPGYIQQRCKIGKAHYRPVRLALCQKFDISYDSIPPDLNLMKNCDSGRCIEPNHYIPRGYHSVKMGDLEYLDSIKGDIFSEEEAKSKLGVTDDKSMEIAKEGIQNFMDKLNKMGEK